MSLYAGIGVGQGDDSHVAGVTAAQDAFDRLGSSKADVLLVFAAARYDQEKMLSGIHSVAKNCLVIGCSTAGEITSDGAVSKDAIVVMAIQSDTIRFFGAVSDKVKDNPLEAAKTVARTVRDQAGGHLDGYFLFPDVLVGNGADIVRGTLDILGPHFPIVGGASADDGAFNETFQYLGDKVYTGAVVALGLVGHFKLGVGVRHGWVPVGLPKRVTKASGSIVYEIDGKPAISFYDDYFGEAAKLLHSEKLAKLAITYPIGIKSEKETDTNARGREAANPEEMLIRTPLSVDVNGAITCTAEVPEGSEIQLMIGSREEAMKGAREAARRAAEQLDGAQPRLAFIFNSIARGKLLATHTDQELSTIQEPIGKNVPTVGFYSFGEIAPLDGEVRNPTKCIPTFHNETVVVCILGE